MNFVVNVMCARFGSLSRLDDVVLLLSEIMNSAFVFGTDLCIIVIIVFNGV